MRTDQAADASLRRGDSDRLYTMVRDGLLPSLDLEDVVRAREQWWITIGEAASILGVNRTRVRQLVNAGRLPCRMTTR